MKTLALLLPVTFLLSPILSAQSPTATVVYTKPSSADVYIAANAGATFVKADQNGLTFKRSNGHFQLVTGPGLTYQQNGQWFPTKLQVGAVSDGSGWVLNGTAITASLTGSQNQDKNLSVTSGAVTFNIRAPQLAYGGADTFTFQEGSTNWLMRVAEASVSLQATIAKRQGKSGARHTFAFTAPGVTLQTDSNGHLHAGGQVHMTRPLIVGANKKIYYVCSPWSSGPATVSFTCDDTTLPDAAFPYVIDPTVTIGPDFDPNQEEYMAYGAYNGQWFGAQVEIGYYWTAVNFWLYQVLPTNSYVANWETDVTLNGLDGLTWDVQPDPNMAPTTCSFGAPTGMPQDVEIPLGMSFINDYAEHGCIMSTSGAGNMSLTIDYVPAITAPSVWGPASIVAGTSYGYQADYAQTGTGGTPQYQFNWGDGTNTGWLPVGTQTASHTWSAAGTYTVTAQAQDPSDNVAIATSSGFTVTVAPLVPITIATYPVNLSYTVDGTGYSSGYSSPQTFQWAPGTQHTLSTSSPQQNANGLQFVFSNWSDGATALTDTITAPNTAATWTARFNQQESVTIASSPPGLSLTVDGGPCTSPCVFQWLALSSHTIGTTSTQGAGGTQYQFSNWTDGGALSHSINLNSSTTNYAANFLTQYYLTTSAAPAGEGSVSPASGWYNSGQVVSVSASGSAGYAFAGFSGALSGAATPQSLTMTAPASVAANFGTLALATITNSPSSSTFWVDGVGYAGSASFVPQPGGDTLAVVQTAPPAGGPVPRYQFSSTGGGIAPQEVAVPPNGPGGGSCPWRCSGGSCLSPVPTGGPQPAPVIASVTLDAAGQIPAVLVPGVPTTIYINGSNFETAPGIASFCTAGGTPCTFYANLQIGETIQSWTNTQIVDLVTMDPQTPPGPWELFLNVPFWIPAGYGMNPSMGNVEVVQVAMKLTQVGATTINPSNNYSEDTTIQVTAVDSSTGETLSDFTGTVNIAEDGTTIYTQNGGTLVKGSSTNPPSVTITSGGTATFVAQSLAGPKVAGPNGQPPDAAEIKTTNYPVYGGTDLAVTQWIISNTQIDRHAADPSTTYDWFQTRARDVFAAATGDLQTVLNAVSTYSLSGTINGCATSVMRATQSSVTCNPFYTTRRIGSDAGAVCGNARPNGFTTSLYHEARHAYQGFLSSIAGNDADGDWLVNNIPIAPTMGFVDTTAPRLVCNATVFPGSTLILAYHGDTVADAMDAPDFARYALEMDAYVFAGSH